MSSAGGYTKVYLEERKRLEGRSGPGRPKKRLPADERIKLKLIREKLRNDPNRSVKAKPLTTCQWVDKVGRRQKSSRGVMSPSVQVPLSEETTMKGRARKKKDIPDQGVINQKENVDLETPLKETLQSQKNKVSSEIEFLLSEFQEEAKEVEPILCNHCIRKAVAVSFCGDCKDVSNEGNKDGVRFLCDKCEEYHSFSVATSTHPSHPIGEYLRKEGEPSFGDVVVCGNNPHGDVKKGPFMFCKKCDGVVCSACHGNNNGPCRANHSGDVVTLSEGVQEVMERVGVWRRGVGKTLSLIRTESAQIQRRIAELNTTERKAVLKEVDDAFVRLLHAQVARHLAVKAEVGVALDSAAAFLKGKEEERVAGMKSGLQFGMFLKGVLDTPKDQLGVILRGYRLIGERKREVSGSGGGQEEDDWWGGLFRGGGSPVECQKVGFLSVADEGVLLGEIKKFVGVEQLGTTATQQSPQFSNDNQQSQTANNLQQQPQQPHQKPCQCQSPANQ